MRNMRLRATRLWLVAIGAALMSLVWAGSSRADFTLDFPASSGTLAADALFQLTGSTLTVTLTNTSTADVLVPTDVLTAVFFDTVPTTTLTRVSAVLAPGSTVLFGGTDAGGVVGGEWAYTSGLSGAPLGASQGISSVGFGLFGPGDVFPGSNLQGPADPNGLQYGLTSAGDNPATGNTPVTGTNALIQNAVVFTLTVPTGTTLTGITNVSFQYGTALTETNIPPGVIPEPSTMAIAGLGALGFVGYGLRRRKALRG